MSSKESISYWGVGSAIKIKPSMTNPKTTKRPNTKYQRPNSLNVAGKDAKGKIMLYVYRNNCGDI